VPFCRVLAIQFTQRVIYLSVWLEDGTSSQFFTDSLESLKTWFVGLVYELHRVSIICLREYTHLTSVNVRC
jgi:hypothetical protein